MNFFQYQTDQMETVPTETPKCAYFGECGGCAYQHLAYEEELLLKSKALKQLFDQAFPEEAFEWDAVVASPISYHYRHRLDLTMRKTRDGFMMGFQKADTRKIISIERCEIAQKEVCEFIPELYQQALSTWKEGYRNANLVVRTGDDGRVLWGGMGRHSLRLKPEDYFWTAINRKKIFYSLDAFFQANLAILPKLMNHIQSLGLLHANTFFLDLYAGVGLFGVYFSDQVKRVAFIEDAVTSVEVMKHNIQHHQIQDPLVGQGRVEELLPAYLQEFKGMSTVAMIDPPRKGLHASALQTLCHADGLEHLLYLSCNPESLVRDLKVLRQGGWKVERITPFDFFPRTNHLETLVVLSSQKRASL